MRNLLKVVIRSSGSEGSPDAYAELHYLLFPLTDILLRYLFLFYYFQSTSQFLWLFDCFFKKSVTFVKNNATNE